MTAVNPSTGYRVYPRTQAALFQYIVGADFSPSVVLTEALTFPGIKAAAAKLRVRLVAVAMDGEGLDPDALKAACKRHRPKAVYLIPTLHNPTTITLGPERRKAVANIIRHAGTILIEDTPTDCWNRRPHRSRI